VSVHGLTDFQGRSIAEWPIALKWFLGNDFLYDFCGRLCALLFLFGRCLAERPWSYGPALLSVFGSQLQASGFSVPLLTGDASGDWQAGIPRRVSKAGQAAIAKAVVLVLAFFMLRLFFRYRGDPTCLRLDCAVLRPFANIFARREREGYCLAGSDACLKSDVCNISYYVFAFLCNAVVHRFLKTTGLVVH
jgi:hypothetical protein